MPKYSVKNAPVILKKMAGFLFASYNRNKTFSVLTGYIILAFFLISAIISPLYSMSVSSDNFNLGIITFLHAGGAVTSGGNAAVWTAVGENIAALAELGNANFSSITGQLHFFVEPLPPLHWVISNLQAKTEILGFFINEATWQKDSDPYFYWQVDVLPPDTIDGFSVSLDALPALEINTEASSYQFPDNSIASGKHTFYVLPYTAAKGWEQQSLLSFEIWVDVDSPLIGSVQPQSGTLTSDNRITITGILSDAHSGIDVIATTLTVNGNSVSFDYDAEQQLLTYKPESALAEGDNSVILKAFDAVGNSEAKTWNFIVDTLPPTGAILINSGQHVTHSAYVTINIEASDATSGLKNIYLSNDGVFDTELASPYPYSPSISDWLLSDPDINGAKTVYAKFEDLTGNFSDAYTATIDLELLTPNTRIISGPPTITEKTEAKFIYEASKAGCLYSYKIDNLDWTDWRSEDKAEFDGLATGNHYFYVKSGFDLNGDGKITVDEEDPTPAQWVWTVKPEGYFEKLKERILFWRR